MVFTVCKVDLTQEGALASFTVFEAYCYFVGQVYRVVQKTDTLCFVRLLYALLSSNIDRFSN